jgi:hypothetical protein
MMKALCNFMFFTHDKCKNELHEFKLVRDGEERKLLGQIQELKAVNHYQTQDLEQKVVALELKVKALEEQNRLLKAKMKRIKRRKSNGKV